VNPNAAFLPLFTAIAPIKQLDPMPEPVAAFWSHMTGKSISKILEKKIIFGDGKQMPTPFAKDKAGWVSGDVTWDTWVETVPGSSAETRVLRVRGYNPVTLPAMVAQAANKWLAESAKGGVKAVSDTVSSGTKAVSTALMPMIQATTKATSNAITTATGGGKKPGTSTKNAANIPSETPGMVVDDAVIEYAAQQAVDGGMKWWHWLAGASVLTAIGYVVVRRRKRGA